MSMSAVAIMAALAAIDKIASVPAQRRRDEFVKLAAQMRNATQAQIDEIYRAMNNNPIASGFIGIVKDALIKKNQNLNKQLKAAQLKQKTEEAAIESTGAAIDDDVNKDVISRVLSPHRKQDAESGMTALKSLQDTKVEDYINKLENKA